MDAFRSKHLEYGSIDTFDLTSGMLERFRRELNSRSIPRVELQQSDVRKLGSLPVAWTVYDLILSHPCSSTFPKRSFRTRPRRCMRGRLGLATWES